jgi:hypothetical protein
MNMRRCRICGCTEDRACPGDCEWIGPDLCSACVDEDGIPYDDPSYQDADDPLPKSPPDGAPPPGHPCRYGHRPLWLDAQRGYCVRCGELFHA